MNLIKKYYKDLDWCVITPYDAQRAAITAAIKTAGVERHDHVYNVDSFQGHEALYIIVSTVRTSSAGFLKSLNRMNIMLTRCKAGLVIVTQRAFLHNPTGGKRTLLGKLAEHWEDRIGASVVWADTMDVAGERASLPGAAGRNTCLGSSVETLMG
ncbi:AAA domain-containing protein [Daedaleopsis nitida]|nr:AAA domain-containing protein [Daedaleopsis nitida]